MEYLEEFLERGWITENIGEKPLQEEDKECISTPLKFDDDGFLLMAPIKPMKPDTSKWKRLTPKRREMLLSYKMEMEFYSIKKERYDQVEVSTKSKSDSIKEFLESPRRVTMDDGEIPVFEYPCGKWHKGLGTNMRKELPYEMVEHHKAEFSEVQEGSWVQQLLYDKKWRMKEHERMRVWHDQHRQEFFKAQDTTVQLDLFNPGYRPIEKDILHTFVDEPNPTLAWKYFKASMDTVYCMHGTVKINGIYIHLTKEELDEIDRRAKMIGGK